MSAIDHEPCLPRAARRPRWDRRRTGWVIARVAVLGVTVALVAALVS